MFMSLLAFVIVRRESSVIVSTMSVHDFINFLFFLKSNFAVGVISAKQ